jgi:CRP-like cAMP-binding protein
MMAVGCAGQQICGDDNRKFSRDEATSGGCLVNYVALLEGLKEGGDARRYFGAKLPGFVERTIAARQRIFRSGEPIERVPIICDGWAAVVASLRYDRSQIIAFLLPNDLVSAALVFDDKLSFDVQSITSVTYHSYARAEIRASLAANPGLFKAIMDSWIEENLQVVQLAVSLGQCSAEERIARLIMNLFARLTKRGLVKDNSFYFPLRQSHIAEYTGLTSATVSNVIGRFRRSGIVAFKDRSLTIGDPVALQRVCNS